MKNWNEAIEEKIVYLRNEIEVYDDNDCLDGKTKQYQKAYIEYVHKDEICVIIDGGKYDGYDFYFRFNESSPEEILTSDEYKLLKNTEIKVWKDLKKYIIVIDSLSEKSEDLLKVKEMIQLHN